MSTGAKAQGPNWYAAAARASIDAVRGNATERAALKLLVRRISAADKRGQVLRVQAFKTLVKDASAAELKALAGQIEAGDPGLGTLFDLEMSGGFNKAFLRWIAEKARKEEQKAKRGTERPEPKRGTGPPRPNGRRKKWETPPRDEPPPDPPDPKPDPPKPKPKKDGDDEKPDGGTPEGLPEDFGDGGLFDDDVPKADGHSWLRRALRNLGYASKAGLGTLFLFGLPAAVTSLSIETAKAKLIALAMEAGIEALSNVDKVSANRLKKMIGEAAEQGARIVVEYLEEGSGRLTTGELIDLNDKVKHNFAGLDLLARDVPVQVKARGIYGTRGFRIGIERNKNGTLRLRLSRTDNWTLARAYARDFLRLVDQGGSEKWHYNRGGGGGNTARELLKYRKRLEALRAWPKGLTTKDALQDWLTEKAVLVVPQDHLVRAKSAVGQMLYERWQAGKLVMFEGLDESTVVERISIMTGRVRSMGLTTNDLRVIAEIAMNQDAFRSNLKI